MLKDKTDCKDAMKRAEDKNIAINFDNSTHLSEPIETEAKIIVLRENIPLFLHGNVGTECPAQPFFLCDIEWRVCDTGVKISIVI
jgi:hypothetical protein